MDGALSQKCVSISACTECICICVCLYFPARECVCMHDTSRLSFMCSAAVFCSCGLVSCCANPSFCLSVPLCFSCCMALYMPLCYLCLQLVFGWYDIVSCPEPCRLFVQPSRSSCMHCSESTIAAYCQVMRWT